MRLSKKLLLRTYRAATQPYRWFQRELARRAGRIPVSLLYYHRVADDPNPWTISRRGFEQQIDWLQARFDLITLVEAQQRIRGGVNRRPSVCITFDDGYAENCTYAIPLLLERRIPFAYFVVWTNLRDQQPFPHDIARGRPLALNSIDSIRALAEMEVEIGSHTLTHANLGIADEATLRREIVDSKLELEAALERPIRYFAFPFGLRAHLQPLAFEIGRQAGYWGMCSAYGGYNDVPGDCFHLQRFHGDPELDYLKCWLDFDPRARRIGRYPYVSPVTESSPDAKHLDRAEALVGR